MIQKRENKFLHFIAIIVVVIFVGATIMALGSGNLYKNISNNQQTSNRIYKSKTLKFSLLIPNKSDVVEGQTYVDITINGFLLDIVRNGTNFKSLKEYVKDFDTKKRISVSEEKSSTINGYQSISRIEENIATSKKQKIYYVHVDNWVYSLSTSSEELFDDLDQIAQSFKYTP